MNLVCLVNGCYSSTVKQKRLNADFLKIGRQVFHSCKIKYNFSSSPKQLALC